MYNSAELKLFYFNKWGTNCGKSSVSSRL